MLKLDKNLVDSYDRLVPIRIDEDGFWRNYFYEIELCLKAKNQFSRVGDKLTDSEREELSKQVDESLEPSVAIRSQV
jgi:hypothetical protein